MSETTYITLPGTLRTAWNPVARFCRQEPGFPDPDVYDVTATPDALDWRPGHRVLQQEISPELAQQAWEEAREEWARMLAEFDKQPF